MSDNLRCPNHKISNNNKTTNRINIAHISKHSRQTPKASNTQDTQQIKMLKQLQDNYKTTQDKHKTQYVKHKPKTSIHSRYQEQLKITKNQHVQHTIYRNIQEINKLKIPTTPIHQTQSQGIQHLKISRNPRSPQLHDI